MQGSRTFTLVKASTGASEGRFIYTLDNVRLHARSAPSRAGLPSKDSGHVSIAERSLDRIPSGPFPGYDLDHDASAEAVQILLVQARNLRC